jgi:hypothetical protein
MENKFKISGKLEIIERMKSSKNGNPRYKFTVGNSLPIVTGVDSSYGYEITNHDGKPIIITVGTHYGKLTLDSLEG